MPHLNRSLACLLSILVVFAANAQPAGEAGAAPDIDPEALEALKDMADHLKSVKEFGYQLESSHDTLQDSGLKVEFGESRKVLVSRPNRMRVESERRDGMRTVLIFSGEKISVHAPDQNVYAMADQPGDLDASIDFAVTRLRLKAPIADLISPKLYENVSSRLTGALYLGEAVVAGVVCDQLLLSNDYADFQLWITTGEKPVLRRIVITYREEVGQPQFRAQFLEWNLSPNITAKQLQFEPPDDAQRIRFYVDVEPAPSEQEGGT